MSNSRLALHAMFAAGPTEGDVSRAHDEAAAAVGMVLLGIEADAQRTARRYGEPGGIALTFSYTLRPPCQLAMFGPYSPDLRPYEPLRIADMFTRVCTVLHADIGRSDLGSGVGFVRESEVNGDLEFIDWYQYLGPRTVDRLGRERLLGAPAFQITEHKCGGVVMLLAPDPWSENFSRTRVADHLGIALRPLHARNPATGEPIVIQWR